VRENARVKKMTITRLSELRQTPEQFAQIEAIFFETSTRKTFIDPQERAEFQYKYLDIYLKHPEWVFLAVSPDEKIVGYLIVASSTTEEHFSLLASLENFRKPIESLYPAHLHINLTAQARGLNVGSKLLASMEEKLKEAGIAGVHLVTVKTARNVSFYQKNLYELVSETQVNGVTLWMLGKQL
jgi:ribosomal protein S18 acetylase RimI-like enzyme